MKFLKRVFRAVRYAEQSHGFFISLSLIKLKEVIAMVNQLSNKTGIFLDSTLVILGWLAFFSAFFVSNFELGIVLQTVARVLP